MTTEELLGLPPEGYIKILEMSESELQEYLKDICVLEPESSVEELSIEEEIENFSASNSPSKKKASAKKKKSGKISNDDFEKMIDESGILESGNEKLKEMF